MSASIRELYERFRQSDQPRLIILANVVGLFCGALAILYHILVEFLRRLFVDNGKTILSFAHGYYIILIPVVGGAVIGILNFYFTRDARSSYGVPGVMEALTMRGGNIRLRTVVARSLAAATCIGCGGAAGKQGSIVQMGLEVANLLSKWLKLGEKKLRILAACGVAAIVAANYNTPLAAILMVFEVILGEFNTSYLGLISIPVVLSTFIYNLVLGNNAKFTAPVFHTGGLEALPFYLVAGVATGLLGLVYIKVIFNSEVFFNRFLSGSNFFLRPLLGGLGIGIVSFLVPLAFGRGTEGIDLSLQGGLLPSVMLLLIVLKLINVAFTVGAWSTGGGFRAGLFLGAMLGGSMGYLFHALFPAVNISPAACSLIGMGGLFASAAQAPFTAILFAVELTKNYGMILPVAATCATSAYVSRALSDESIFTARLVRRGLDIENARREDILRNILVRHAMNQKVSTLPAAMTVDQAYRKILTGTYSGYPVVDEKGRLVGMATSRSLQRAISEGKQAARLEDVCPARVVAITPRETLRDAVVLFNENNVKRVPVVSKDDPLNILGILTMADVVRAYHEDLETTARKNRLAYTARKKKEAVKKSPAISPAMIIAATEINLGSLNPEDLEVKLEGNAEDGTKAPDQIPLAEGN